MKTLTLVISSLLIGCSAFASEAVILDNVSALDLSIDQSELVVTVGYPGKAISGICELEIVADSYGRANPVKNLLGAVTIENAYVQSGQIVQIASDKVIRIELRTGGYADGVLIKTKDGKSLSQAIRRTLGEGRKVKVVPRSC